MGTQEVVLERQSARLLGLLMALAILVLGACGGGGEGKSEAGTSPEKAPKGTFDLPNGRSL